MYTLSNYNDVQTILTQNAKRFSTQFATSAREGQIRIYDSFHTLRKQVEPKNQQLLDSNTKKIDGISDFSENKLDAGKVLIIDKIKVGYDTSLKDDVEGLLKYQKQPSGSFRNAFIKISQNGVLLSTLYLSELSNRYAGNSVQDDYLVLKSPIVIVGGTDFHFELIFPKGAGPVSDKEYLELTLSGLSVVRSSVA